MEKIVAYNRKKCILSLSLSEGCMSQVTVMKSSCVMLSFSCVTACVITYMYMQQLALHMCIQ